MKILLIHKFHYMLGGTETFHYNLAEALTAAGHEVIFFSMYDERNIPCAQDKYFVSNVDYNDPNLSTFKKIKMGIKLIYSFESKHNIEKLIRDEKPDIAHIGLLHRQITFSVVDVLKKYNIPVVMHLHELTAVCPCYTMLRQDGTICSDCATKGYWNCVKNKCMKGSLAKSVLAYTEAQFLRYGHYYDKIDLYIAECNFYKNLVEKAHFTHSPIIKMNNFLPINQEYKAYYEHDNYILYFGRYAREKGVLTILKAYAKMHCDEKLVLVGKGSEEERIKNFVKEHNLEGRVQVNGAIFGEEMDRIIERAKVVLVPSEWYENGAFVALQALAKGKIVVASDIAGLSEIVQDGETGYLAEPGNPDSFAIAIQKALNLTETEYRNMSARIVVSVVVPIYNVELYLKECVDSILSQTYKNIEVILVDDESPDLCGKICDDYVAMDGRIKVVHKKNGGLSDARNAGMKVATGDLITFVDSDDYISKDFVKILFEAMSENNSDIAIANMKRTSRRDDKNTVIDWKVSSYKNEDALIRMLYGTPFGTSACGKLFKRSLFTGVEFPYGKFSEDLFTIYKTILKSENVTYVGFDGYFYYYRDEGSIVVSGYKEKHLEALDAIDDIARAVKGKTQFDNALSTQYINVVYDIAARNPQLSEFQNKRIQSVLKSNRMNVLKDGNAPKRLRAFAAISLFGNRIALKVVVARNRKWKA